MVPWRQLFRISLKNVFRNRRRTLLTLSILVLGSTGLILVGGFFNSLLDRLRESYIYSVTGHIQIAEKGFFEKGSTAPFEYLMSEAKSKRDLMERQPHVLFTVPRLSFGGMLSTDETSLAVIAYGVDPIAETRMDSAPYAGTGEASGNLLDGKNLDASDPYGVLIGEELRKALGLKVGDKISFITTREFGTIDGAEFHVRGILQTAIKEFGERMIKIPMNTAQEILGLHDQIHSFLVILDSTPNTSTVQMDIDGIVKEKLLNLEAIPWWEGGVVYTQSESFLNEIERVVQIIIGIIFFLSIANTINMALFERMREYGTMMAIGNSRRIVFLTIFIEACVLGFIGALLGVLIGTGIAQMVSSFGIKMPPPPVVSSNFGYIIVIILLNSKILLEAFFISFFATIFSSLLPGYRASHLRIIHALGYV